jgi:phenylpropionate dioxygenase-like ring-hydroxylating dioxygenase large terminal subunit
MSIDPLAYRTQAVFDRELAGPFAERFYAGADPDFPEVDCYKSFLIGPKVVTVRRTSEGLRAFGNVCLHRSNIIDPLGAGKRQFRCGFHGWSYDSNGDLSNVPFSDIECVKSISLPKYHVSQSSGLVFVGVADAPRLDKISTAIERIGLNIGVPFFKKSIVHECNWKVLVENILENYHLNFVHRETFLKSGFTSGSTHDWESDEYVNLGSITPKAETSKLATIRRLAKNATHCYRHAYVFPNLFLSNTNDLIGFISYMHPLGPLRTVLNWELFELPVMTALPNAVKEHIRDEAVQFADQTLAEDKAMVEACQMGISSDTPSMQLQPIEGRVIQFHEYYNERMSNA